MPMIRLSLLVARKRIYSVTASESETLAATYEMSTPPIVASKKWKISGLKTSIVDHIPFLGPVVSFSRRLTEQIVDGLDNLPMNGIVNMIVTG